MLPLPPIKTNTSHHRFCSRYFAAFFFVNLLHLFVLLFLQMFCSFVIFNTGFFFLSVCICFTFHPLFQLLHPIKLQKHLLHALPICFHRHHVSPLCAPLGGGGAQQAARHSQSPFYNNNGRLHDDGSSFSKTSSVHANTVLWRRHAPPSVARHIPETSRWR